MKSSERDAEGATKHHFKLHFLNKGAKYYVDVNNV